MFRAIPARRRSAIYAIAVAMASFLLMATMFSKVADAHGNIVDPASRNYGCFQRWGSDFQNPAMATLDPMCWHAWQTDNQAMWNWNGLFREGAAGNHQGVIPDGQLCSAGLTQGGRYGAMDAVGDWRAQSVANNFRVKLFDQASHGADYIRVYVTRQGYNPITQPLRWADLELTGQIGNTPASQWTQESGGVSIQVPGTAAGRTGRHIIYTIWQASHLDQSYYFCSDVVFGGATPSPTTSASPTPSVTPTSSPSPTPTPTPTLPARTCTAAYTQTGQWTGGFQGSVSVTAGSTAISHWMVTLTWPSGQQITNAWNATVTTSGNTATAHGMSYNSNLAASASTSFGFNGSVSGAPGSPTLACTAI